MEINATDDKYLKDFLVKNLDLDSRDMYEIQGPLDLTFLNKFIDQPGMEQWKFTPYVGQQPEELPDYEDLFGKIREHDILLHHPYESFDPIVKLVAEAAEDPQVLAIKQTLYRVSGNSPLVAALARAAENGKQVTALVELKARFDEENNIVWARRLEKAGCHVIYGLMGLKTHSKIILIVRKEADGIKRYVHLGTGNYNDKTAKLYTDLGLLTANDQYGQDASAFFNVLSGYSEPPVFNKLVMAPIGLREKIYELVDREIAHVKVISTWVHRGQDEFSHRPAGDPEVLRSFPGRSEDRSDRPGHLWPAARDQGGRVRTSPSGPSSAASWNTAGYTISPTMGMKSSTCPART